MHAARASQPRNARACCRRRLAYLCSAARAACARRIASRSARASYSACRARLRIRQSGLVSDRFDDLSRRSLDPAAAADEAANHRLAVDEAVFLDLLACCAGWADNYHRTDRIVGDSNGAGAPRIVAGLQRRIWRSHISGNMVKGRLSGRPGQVISLRPKMR